VPARLVVLASGRGTTAQAILDALGARVVALGADRECGALSRGKAAGTQTFVVPFEQYDDRAAWNRAFEETLAGYQPDLVVLAGFMRLFDAALVERFRVVNTHPALLPSFPGVGGRAVQAALDAGVKLAGATVHVVDAGMDSGPILAQVAVPVEDGDDVDTLFARIQAAEKPLYVETLRRLIEEIENG
jgi:phosphoribosylglycinamide formyltransferase-1